MIGLRLAAAWVLLAGVLLLAWTSGALWGWVVVCGLFELLLLYQCFAAARAFTRCTPAGIRTRGMGRARECPWPEVDDIAPRFSGGGNTVRVMVKTASGTSFPLGVPLTVPGFISDPDWPVTVQQIWAYRDWVTGLGGDDGGGGTAPDDAGEAAAAGG